MFRLFYFYLAREEIFQRKKQKNYVLHVLQMLEASTSFLVLFFEHLSCTLEACIFTRSTTGGAATRKSGWRFPKFSRLGSESRILKENQTPLVPRCVSVGSASRRGETLSGSYPKLAEEFAIEERKGSSKGVGIGEGRRTDQRERRFSEVRIKHHGMACRRTWLQAQSRMREMNAGNRVWTLDRVSSKIAVSNSKPCC